MFSRDYRSNNRYGSSNKQNSAGIYLWEILILLLLIFIFGKELQNFSKGRVIKVEELFVYGEAGFIQGEVDKIYPAQQKIFTVEKTNGGCYIDRSLSAMLPVQWKKVGDSPIFFDAVSPDGERFLLIKGQSISVYDEDTRAVTLIVDGSLYPGDSRDFYSYPSWSKDGTTVYLVHNIFDSNNNKTMQIEALDVASGKTTVITTGNYPAVSKDSSFMLLERDGKIWRHNMKTKQETELAEGYYPALSSDNNYVACIRYNKIEFAGKNNDTSTVDVSDLYVFALDNPRDNKKFSYNYVTKEGKAYYNYSYPVWDVDSLTLYVTREETDNVVNKQIRRYELGKSEPKAQQIANIWLEARQVQDNEALYKYYPGYEPDSTLAVDFTGHSLEEKGMENGGYFTVLKSQVKASGGNYKLINEKFHFENTLEGYRITNIAVKDPSTYVPRKDGIYQINEKGEEKLSEVSAAALVGMNTHRHVLIYLRRGATSYEMHLWNKDSGKDKAIDTLIPNSAQPESISLNKYANVAVVNYKMQETDQIAAYNLVDLKPVSTPFLINIERMFWLDNNMVVYSRDNNLTLRWEYDPGAGTINI